MQSKNTDLHLPKSRCITLSRLMIVLVAARESPERKLRGADVAERADVFCFAAVRADVVRPPDAVLVVVGVVRDMAFLFCGTGREEIVGFGVVVVRDFIVAVLRTFVVGAGRVAEFCVRTEFFATAATAPPDIGTAKHMAKNRFRPFISLSMKNDSRFI